MRHPLPGAVVPVAILVAAAIGCSRGGPAVVSAPSREPAAVPAVSQASGGPPRAFVSAYDCRFADLPIAIDGDLGDAAWADAVSIDSFSMPWLGTADRPAAKATRAKLLWDREYLYVAADMDDADLFADVRQHDGDTWTNDAFAVLLKPSAAKPAFYEFQVTPANTRFDCFFPQRGNVARFRRFDDLEMESAVAVRGTLGSWNDADKGWSVEMRIPWTSLVHTGGRPVVGDAWRFALGRHDHDIGRERCETSTCVPLAERDFHRHEEYAELKFMGPSAAAAARPYGIPKLEPCTTSRVVGSPEPALPYTVERALPLAKLTCPIFVAHQPGSDLLLYATEPRSYAPSKVMRIRDDPGSFAPELILPDEGSVHYGIEFHPRFAENGFFYVGSNGPTRRTNADGTVVAGPIMSRITRYRMDPKPPHKVDPASAEVVIEWDSDGHNGAVMAFGPDGMLYVTSGDGTKDSDVDLAGQDLSRLRSKLLRIDVDHPDETTPGDGRCYSVPRDNPFVGMDGVRPETWAYGLRNPWRITIDQETGQIWVGNNGQDLWEQIYLVERAANYGWSIVEGTQPFALGRKAGPHPISKPVAEHPHADARSLTGGIVYRGDALPELRGAYIYGDYSTGKIWGIRHDGTKVTWHKLLADTTLQISAFGVDSRGEMLIVDHQGGDAGGFYRLVPMPPPDPSRPPFPRRLSETGLFTSLRGHVPAPGVIPYDVNAPGWNDAAHSRRFFAVPAATGSSGVVPGRIDVTNINSWNFPNGTVVAQSLAIEEEEGDPRSLRWVETRLMHKEAGEWVGYSYEWNDEQTDAVLVTDEGMDRQFAVRTADLGSHPDGVRMQSWRFPSRTECMICHSRASNFVLGLTTVQLNRDFDYAAALGPGHATDNQLRTLEQLGILTVNWWGDAYARNLARAKERLDGDPQVAAWMADRYASKDPDHWKFARPSTLLSRPPEATNRLANPADTTADLSARARSYLQTNCGCCHVNAGGGNAQIELTYMNAFETFPLDAMKLVGGRPLHQTFDLPDPLLVAPGHPERSVLMARVSRRGPGQMPQIGSTVVDRRAVEMLREWIESMRPRESLSRLDPPPQR
jgi:glucose/arabinose dehydrogenase